MLLLGEADELPVVGEAAAVAVAEVLEDDLAGPAEAGRHLEQLDKVLGGQPAGKEFAGRLQGGVVGKRPDRLVTPARSV